MSFAQLIVKETKYFLLSYSYITPTKMTAIPSGPSLSGKVIAITGGASGIGLALAKTLASLGAKVSIGDLSADALEKVAREIQAEGGKVFVKVIDVRKKETVESWISGTVNAFGKLDGAANMAGVIGKNHGKMFVSFHGNSLRPTTDFDSLRNLMIMNGTLLWT
jgi:NAD(P)-dependent dehydrogenase (short-subunit alcohol dehydrogenase family)